MEVLTHALIVTIAAVGNRVRGGMFSKALKTAVPLYGTTVGRIIYGLTLGASTLVLGGSLILAGLVALGTFIGHVIAPFAPFQYMERSNDVLITSLRGLILTTATGVAIMALHSVPGGVIFSLGGLIMGPAYLLGSKLPTIKIFNDDPSTAHTNDTSEVIFGMLTGVLLILSI